jgi:surface antigen
MRLNIVLAVVASMGLAACTPQLASPPASQPVPRLSEPGTLFGALLAGNVGAGISGSDVPIARQAIADAHATRAGARVEWRNPETGNGGSITPIREGYAQNGAFCREYHQSLTVAGRTEQVLGISCRQPDGQWRLVSN